MRKYLWFFLSLSFFSCSEKSFIEMPSNENPNEQKVAQEAKAQVALSDVSQKCLNVALYAKALASLDSSVLALQSTTDVVFQPLNEARDSFRLTTAFGNFRFQKIREL
jgi:hypothetical protein